MNGVVPTLVYRSFLAKFAEAGWQESGYTVPEVSRVEFGTGSTPESPADTELESGLVSVIPDSITIVDATVTIKITLTAAQTNGSAITEVGIFGRYMGDGASSEMIECEMLMGRRVFAPKVLVGDDTSEFTITITF